MDHLPFPSKPISPKPRIPLICDPHGIGDFMSYPTDAKRLYTSSIEAAAWQDQLLIQHGQQTIEDVESFMQAWLYFSMLRTFNLDPSRYIEDNFVHTRNLCKDLDSWAATDLVYVRKCLSHASAVLDVVSLRGLVPTTNISLRMSTMALYEVLGNALDRADRKGVMRVTAYRMPEEAKELLLTHGWCPFEIHTCFTAAYSFSHSFYLQHLSKGVGSHPDCTKNECKRATIDSKYRPRHICDDADTCELIGLDFTDIKKCLDEGIQPVIDIQGTTAHDLTLVIGTGSYVAWSHVWSEGLGNPHANALPRCQLYQVMLAIRMLERRSKKKLCIWIDTLCCPTDRVYKQISLKSMAAVYRNSFCTVVCDEGLDEYRITDFKGVEGAVELAVRITISRWAHRLWTLQEAGLPDHLLLKFDKGLIDMETIWPPLQEVRLSHRHYESICDWLVHFYGTLRASFVPRLGADRRRDLSFFVQRRVSDPTDEAICLATLLGIPMPEVAPQNRMDALWKVIPVPQSIIFNKFPRSHTFRWAPSTLLISDAKISLDGKAMASLTGDGLLVAARWQRLEIMYFDVPLRDMLLKELAEATTTMMLHNGAEIFDITDAFESHYGKIVPDVTGTLRHQYGPVKALLQDHTRTWYMIVEQDRTTKTALLAYETRQVDNTPVLRSAGILNIVEQSDVRERRIADQLAIAFRFTRLPRCLRNVIDCQGGIMYLAAFVCLWRLRACWRLLRSIKSMVERYCYSALFLLCQVKVVDPHTGQLRSTTNFQRWRLVIESYMSIQIWFGADSGPKGQCYIE